MRVRHLDQNKVNSNQPWWDLECETAKQLKYAALRRFRCTSNLIDFQQFVNTSGKIKKI